MSLKAHLCCPACKHVLSAVVLRHGLTRKEMQLLRLLCDVSINEPVVPGYGELARRMGTFGKSNISRLVHALRDKGMVTRALPLNVTEEGWALFGFKRGADNA